MIGNEKSIMTNSEILAVSKILLESRAFTKAEMNSILDKMILGCIPIKNMDLVSDLIANEKYHYVELHHRSHINEKLWELGNEIKQCNLLEIVYQKQVSSKNTVKRIIQPVVIIFSEYYFYLNAYIVERDGNEKYHKKYDYPVIYRLDRIVKYKQIGKKFITPYTERFEEGEFRKRIQFMFAGKLTKLQMKYTGNNIEAILDRLPTAKIISKQDDGWIVEAEVFGKGIVMWLLSQGKNIEILRPESMRNEMKDILLEMLKKYE